MVSPSVELVASVLRHSSRLCVLPSYKDVRLFPDRTPMQSILYRALKQKISNRIQNGEKDLFIRHFNGYPKIVKRSPRLSLN